MASLLRRINQRACITLSETLHELQDRALNDSTVVTGGNVLFYSIRKALKTFKDLASFIFDMISNIPQVHFSTNMYREFSVKSMERMLKKNFRCFAYEGKEYEVPQDFKFLM